MRLPFSDGGSICRNDQNVLATIPAQYRQISLNKSSTSGGSLEGEYSTDAGLVVPGISSGLRDRLMLAAEARSGNTRIRRSILRSTSCFFKQCSSIFRGISRERMTELVARSVSDLTIQMLGGERRLNPDNSHQGNGRPFILKSESLMVKSTVFRQKLSLQ